MENLVSDEGRHLVPALRARLGHLADAGPPVVEGGTVVGVSDAQAAYVKDRPGHDRRYALNCKKIETELGWSPAIPLEDGLRQTIDWYRDHGNWLAGVRSRVYLSYYEKYYENRESSLRAIARSGSMASD